MFFSVLFREIPWQILFLVFFFSVAKSSAYSSSFLFVVAIY